MRCLPCSADVAGFLGTCQAASGGFGGGPRQMPHLAPSYAAVSTLVTLGGDTGLSTINRLGMQKFLEAMAVLPGQGGGFQVCQGARAVWGHSSQHTYLHDAIEQFATKQRHTVCRQIRGAFPDLPWLTDM